MRFVTETLETISGLSRLVPVGAECERFRLNCQCFCAFPRVDSGLLGIFSMIKAPEFERSVSTPPSLRRWKWIPVQTMLRQVCDCNPGGCLQGVQTFFARSLGSRHPLRYVTLHDVTLHQKTSHCITVHVHCHLQLHHFLTVLFDFYPVRAVQYSTARYLCITITLPLQYLYVFGTVFVTFFVSVTVTITMHNFMTFHFIPFHSIPVHYTTLHNTTPCLTILYFCFFFFLIYILIF